MPSRQKVQKECVSVSGEESSSIAHIFKKKEPRIAFVSQWRKARVSTIIQKQLCSLWINPCRALFLELGAGWEVIPERHGAWAEGPAGRPLLLMSGRGWERR